MKRTTIFLLTLLSLGLITLSAQDTPPEGTPKIRMKVTEQKEIKFTLRAYDPQTYVWFEIAPNEFIKKEISYDYDNPSEFTITSKSPSLNVWGYIPEMSCSDNGEWIQEIDMAGHPEIGVLYCHKNSIRVLKIDHCPLLWDLSCGNNQISTLDLNGLPMLNYLHCYKNQIKKLDVGALTGLIELACDQNQISELNVAPLNRLELLYCSNNQIQSITFNKADRLKEFSAASNQIKSIDLSALTAAESIYLGSNLLEEISIPKSEKLKKLHLSLNKNLKHISFAEDNVIEDFRAMECGLEKIDLTFLKNAKQIHLNNNLLQEVKLSDELSRLSQLVLIHNRLSPCGLDSIYQALPKAAQEGGSLKVKENPGSSTSTTSTAEEKGWTVDVQGNGKGCTESVEAINDESYLFVLPGGVEWVAGVEGSIEIFDTSGQQLHSHDLQPGSHLFISLDRGTYLVRFGKKCQKILIL